MSYGFWGVSNPQIGPDNPRQGSGSIKQGKIWKDMDSKAISANDAEMRIIFSHANLLPVRSCYSGLYHSDLAFLCFEMGH
jgi:hypothetical protein